MTRAGLPVLIAPAPASPVKAPFADRLLFGRAVPCGGLGSKPMWEAFPAEVLPPRFPGGLTVRRA